MGENKRHIAQVGLRVWKLRRTGNAIQTAYRALSLVLILGHTNPIQAQRSIPARASASVLINEARSIDGKSVIGSPLRVAEGPFMGDGTISDPGRVAAVFDAIDRLPVSDQARLAGNRFSNVLLELDLDGDAEPERFFLTVRFPANRFVRERRNPLTGVEETLIYEDGVWRGSIDDRRILEIDVNEGRIESASRLYANIGTRGEPVRGGAPIEETRTVEFWHRDWAGAAADPRQAILAKVRVNYVTGRTTREVFAMFPRAVEIADSQFVSRFDYNEFGLLQSAEIFQNGRSDEDFRRPLMERLERAIAGEKRFEMVAAPALPDIAALREAGYRLSVERRDVLKGVTRRIEFDLARGGRIARESYDEDLDGRTIGFESLNEYADTIYHGLIPRGGQIRERESGRILETIETESYDELGQRLVARSVDYTGRELVKTWDPTSESPVSVASAQRRTETRYDRLGLAFESETVSVAGDERLSESTGVYDADAKVWNVTRRIWFSPEILLREESLNLSPAGTILSVEVSAGLRTALGYADDGTREMSNTYRDGALVRIEDEFNWEAGSCSSRARCPIGGDLYDEFRVGYDAEGRLVRDGAREFGVINLQLETELEYEGASERVVRAETRQNNVVRSSFRPGAPVQQADGSWWLPVVETPAWGTASTAHFALGGGSSLPLRTDLASGGRDVIIEAFPGGSMPRLIRRIDASGKVFEELVRAPAQDGYDLVSHYRIAEDGRRRLAATRHVARGTDVTVFSDVDRRRRFFDLSKPYPHPHFEIDRAGQRGVNLLIDGKLRENVVERFWARADDDAGVLRVESVELGGFFSAMMIERSYDQMGRILEESSRRVQGDPTEPEGLVERGRSLPPEVRNQYRYGASGVSPDDIIISDSDGTVLRRLTDPRPAARNPYLPDIDEIWTLWTRTDLAPDGSTLFVSEVYRDSAGRSATVVSDKVNAKGKASRRISYQLVPLASDEWEATGKIGTGGIEDFSDCHFIACFLKARTGVEPAMLISDGNGLAVTVSDAAGAALKFWPVAARKVQWLPHRDDARQAAGVSIGSAEEAGQKILVVSVPGLRAAGIDVSRIMSLELQAAAECFHSGILRLSSNEPVRSLNAPDMYGSGQITHTSGISTIGRAPDSGSASDLERQQRDHEHYWSSDLHFGGNPIARIRPRSEAAEYPIVILEDYSNPDSPLPLYALVAENGELIEHYHSIDRGHSLVYTIAPGFRPAKLELYRSDILEDESSPSILASGEGYQINLPLSRTRAFHNQIASSIFKVAGDTVAKAMGSDDGSMRLSSPLSSRDLHLASSQQQAIEALPSLAGSILPHRPLPWVAGAKSVPNAIPMAPLFDTAELEKWMADGIDDDLDSHATPLIRTSPGTEDEDFADTVEEVELVKLAIRLGQYQLAASILDFYWDETKGGITPAHESYDRRTGASLELVPRYERAPASPRSAAAQIAIVEAALEFATATGDRNAWQLATKMIDMIWDEFRRPDGDLGIGEALSKAPIKRAGFHLWPAAQRYNLETNARALIALHRMDELGAQFGDAPGLDGKLRDQAQWLRANFVDRIAVDGIVPNGLFEIQDLQSETEALGVSKWTSASAWLAFLEAADLIGVPREKTHRWLENLARIHGVRHGRIWGLDWSLALSRPDVVSPEMTAKFYQLAMRLEHTEAVEFARDQLAAILAQAPERAPAKVISSFAPGKRLPTGQGSSIYPLANASGWPITLAPFVSIGDADGLWPALPMSAVRMRATQPAAEPDLSAVISVSVYFYLSILIVAIFWWILRSIQLGRHKHDPSPLVGDLVLAAAEERWAKRVMGVCSPDGCEHSRFAHGPVEANFLIQLRAIYKLVVEWRRLDLGWELDDPRLIESEEDAWLNGADEFAMVVALYMRFVIKSGRKDGFESGDIFEGEEDSNYLWARLVLYFSEYYWGLLTLIDRFNDASPGHELNEANQQIFLLLNGLGMRNRKLGFDARTQLNFPENPDAFDLMIVQKQGAKLSDVVDAAAAKLAIPERQFRRFLSNYKAFKKREDPAPVHPFIFEAAKMMPHFILMTLIGVVWYNNEISGLPIVPYLRDAIARLAVPRSLLWAIPLVVGYGLNIAAYYIRYMRYEAGMRASSGGLRRLLPFKRVWQQTAYVLPLIKDGRGWDPSTYARLGYILRGIGFLIIGVELMLLPAPSFAVFLILKGLLATVLLAEAAAIIFPLTATWLSMVIQQYAASHPGAGRLTQFANSLNITATRPASIVWLSIAYHYPISVPSGRTSALVRAVLYYFAFAALFLFAGSYVLKEVIGVWFAEAYQMGWDLRILFGGVLFFNTMYLMRFGLSVLLTAIGAAIVSYPLRVLIAAAALGVWVAVAADPGLQSDLAASPWAILLPLGLALAAVAFEERLLVALRRCPPFASIRDRSQREMGEKLQEYRDDPSRTLGVVYMSGDDLGYGRLTSELMMARWDILRDQLGSTSARLLETLPVVASDEDLARGFSELYECEEKSEVTLWHPMQIVVGEDAPVLPEPLGLNIHLGSLEERERLLEVWHLRRWIVSMMSTAGHSQDTAINLIDVALRLDRERLGERVVFYLIQNKYDDRTDNRPGQMDYRRGELGQREKLASFLEAITPGSKAFSLNDWTPFGFKAGGMMAMDLVYEETLQLTNMLVMDRNATVHDLDALMEDITTALTDPGVVNVVPGRSTTNTLTPIGQGSQAMEEGHRQLMKGIMLLGGEAGESVGTGWGNIQAIYYGRIQRAMMDVNTRQMPLTTRMVRGSSFSDRLEGMIGFAPHAVGISEDIWAVIQGAHSAIALGYRVKFKRSKAMWHKIRETWSHADWFSAFPRWSGGYLQLMQDPLMQRINDRGPMSLFAKELRANNGRFYLSAPFALLSILIMPLAILLDASPFVQILIVLWNFGFIMNQVLTSLGLMANLEASGFSKLSALAGGGAAGCGSLVAGQPLAIAAVATVLGFLAGGFLIGLGRWLLDRGRDMILFGPQLVIHALGQLVRQSLEFVLSGAAVTDASAVNIAFRAWVGPREDRASAGYGNIVNLRSVVWGAGLLSVALNLFALSKLDFQNVVLLLPSLLFSVSCLLGPFLLAPRPGDSLRGWAWIPKVLGWLAGFTFYTVVAMLVASAGWREWVALGALAASFIWLAAVGLRFVGFSRRLARARTSVTEAIAAQGGGIDPDTAAGLSQRMIGAGIGDLASIEKPLLAAGIAPSAASSIASHVQDRIHPVLKSAFPAHDSQRRRGGRFACELRRSLTLSLATFIWFLVVPVPGLLIFTAGDFRIGLGLMPFVWSVVAAVGFVLAAATLGRVAERVTRGGLSGKGGLARRIEASYARFLNSDRLDAEKTSAVYALFTDTQTYFDQRSYAYVRRSLDDIDAVLEA